jgi:hypothetical protein
MKKINLFSALMIMTVSLSFWGCKSNDIEERKINKMGPKSYSLNVMVIPGMDYFPENSFLISEDEPDSAGQAYFSALLVDGKSKKMYKGREGWERYRLIVDPPDDRAFIIEFEKQNYLYNVGWKDLVKDSTGAKHIVSDYNMIVPDTKEWKQFKKKLEKGKYFELSTNSFETDQIKARKKPEKETVYILEAEDQGKYHVVKRSNIKKKSDLFDIVEYMLSLTTIKIDK